MRLPGRRAYACPMSFANPTELLLSLTGTWEGTTKTWFDPAVLADESPCRGTIRRMFDSRFVTHEYESAHGGKPLRGFAMMGFNEESKLVEVAWIDTFHMSTAMMFSTGAPRPEGFSVLGSYGDGKGGPRWGWRTELRVEGPDALILTAYNISPAGEEGRALETRYRRVLQVVPS